MSNPYLIFADNTVCVNFAHMQLMDVLKALCRGNGRWCRTVSVEAQKSVTHVPAVADSFEIFGTPIDPNPSERIDAYGIRERMSRPGDEAWKHMGEAETIAIIDGRGFQAFIITDDRDAKRHAASRQIRSIDTFDLLKMACRVELITTAQAWQGVQTLIDAAQGVPGKHRDPARFREWLTP